MKRSQNSLNLLKKGIIAERVTQFVVAPAIYLMYRDEDKFNNWDASFRFFEPLVSILYILVLWEGNRILTKWWTVKFPLFKDQPKRLIYLLLTCTLFIFLINAGMQMYISTTGLVKTFTLSAFRTNFIGGLLISYLIIAIHEGITFYEGWKQNLIKSEALARERAEMQSALVEAQLSALRDQLNPHFLFNSLNTLSSLIDLKNSKAITYLEQLADVYRYLLENREKQLVELESELKFAESFIYLNKIRFREDLKYSVSHDIGAGALKIPPYALQILLENAIKHNSASAASPLRVEVTVKKEFIEVSNNKNPKNLPPPSTQLGLQNLMKRCLLVTGKSLEVHDSQQSFSVKVPLVLDEEVSKIADHYHKFFSLNNGNNNT